jgi:hypothetical protein
MAPKTVRGETHPDLCVKHARLHTLNLAGPALQIRGALADTKPAISCCLLIPSGQTHHLRRGW